MSEHLKFQPVRHNHTAFVAQARERKGFSEAYDALASEYQLASQLIEARSELQVRLVPQK